MSTKKVLSEVLSSGSIFVEFLPPGGYHHWNPARWVPSAISTWGW